MLGTVWPSLPQHSRPIFGQVHHSRRHESKCRPHTLAFKGSCYLHHQNALQIIIADDEGIQPNVFAFLRRSPTLEQRAVSPTQPTFHDTDCVTCGYQPLHEPIRRPRLIKSPFEGHRPSTAPDLCLHDCQKLTLVIARWVQPHDHEHILRIAAPISHSRRVLTIGQRCSSFERKGYTKCDQDVGQSFDNRC